MAASSRGRLPVAHFHVLAAVLPAESFRWLKPSFIEAFGYLNGELSKVSAIRGVSEDGYPVLMRR